MTSSTKQQLGSESTLKTPAKNGLAKNGTVPNTANSSRIPTVSPFEDSEPRTDLHKFDVLLDQVIDTHKIDLRNIQTWLYDYLYKKKRITQFQLISDLIIDYLKAEQFPDAKVIQCELADYGILSEVRVQSLMRKLWDELLDDQLNNRSSKYQKISTPRGSTTKISSSSGSSSSSSADRHHGYYANYHPSRSHYDHQTSQL